MKIRDNDPDETEGRALYRARADHQVYVQEAMARRKVNLKEALSSTPSLEKKDTKDVDDTE